MLNKMFLVLIGLFALLGPVSGQESKEPKGADKIEAIVSASKVDGLELPPDQTVTFDEGFVNLQAKCKGDVKWLVVSAVKVKYITVPGNSLIISVPPQAGVTITVFAIGSVDGKLTEFARTNITVANGTDPNPGPGPGPGPLPAPGPLHVTFLIDFNNTTPDLARVLNSPTLRNAITAKGNFMRVYNIKAPIVAEKKLDQVVAKVGGNAVIVVQRNDGFVVVAERIPLTEAEVLQLINRAGGL